jgi:hypothetical protein
VPYLRDGLIVDKVRAPRESTNRLSLPVDSHPPRATPSKEINKVNRTHGGNSQSVFNSPGVSMSELPRNDQHVRTAVPVLFHTHRPSRRRTIRRLNQQDSQACSDASYLKIMIGILTPSES